MSISFTLSTVSIIILLIPVLCIFLYFLMRISFDRWLVSGKFPLILLSYILVSLIILGASIKHSNDYSKYQESAVNNDSTPCDSLIQKGISPNKPKEQTINKNEIDIWTHLVAQGSTEQIGEKWFTSILLDLIGVLFFNVLLITILINSVSRRQDKWKKGVLRYNHSMYGILCHKYVVAILGNHESFVNIARQCISRDKTDKKKPDYVLIMVRDDVEGTRAKLKSVLTKKQMRKVVVCQGSIVSRLDLQTIHIEKAMEVFLVGDLISQENRYSTHDACCIKSLQHIRGYYDNGIKIQGIVNEKTRDTSKGALDCKVFFEYQTSYSAFQTTDVNVGEIMTLPTRDGKLQQMPVVLFKPLNFYELCCERVLTVKNGDINKSEHEDDNNETVGYLPLDGNEGISKDSDRFVHLIIVGQTKMGTALALEAAQIAHFPNFFKTDKKGNRIGPRTRISFIDSDADIEMNFLTGRLRYLFEVSRRRFLILNENTDTGWVDPLSDGTSIFSGEHLGKDFVDVEWEFVKGNLSSSSVNEYLISATSCADAICTLAICMPNQNKSVAAALYLPAEIINNVQQVLVYQRYGGSVLDELNQALGSSHYRKFKSFGNITKFYDDEYCSRIEKQIDNGLYGSKMQNGKSRIARWWSDRYRYNMWWTKMRSISGSSEVSKDLIETNGAILAKVEHMRWNMEQLLLGFRPLTMYEQADCLSSLRTDCKDCSEHFKCTDKKVEQLQQDMIQESEWELYLEDYKWRKSNGCILFDNKKNNYKAQLKAHLDICSDERLWIIDPSVLDYDFPKDDKLYPKA